MAVTVLSEQQVIGEATTVLVSHLGPSKAARFLSACRLGGGDYLAVREELFKGETVDSLYDKVHTFQQTRAVQRAGSAEEKG